jgi:hypothetical protein
MMAAVCFIVSTLTLFAIWVGANFANSDGGTFSDFVNVNVLCLLTYATMDAETAQKSCPAKLDVRDLSFQCSMLL